MSSDKRKFWGKIVGPLYEGSSAQPPEYIENYIFFLTNCGIQIEKKNGKYHIKILTEVTRDFMDDILKKIGDFRRKNEN